MVGQIFVDGLLMGGLLALAAVGFSLIFGVMGVLNLTHGMTILLGAYISLYSWTLFGIDPLLSLPLVLAAMFVFGYIYHKLIIDRIVHEEILVTLLVTYGVTLMIRNFLEVYISADYRLINPPYSGTSVEVAGLIIPTIRTIGFFVSIILILVLVWILHQTDFGRAIRATAERPNAAQLCGINTSRIYALTFGISAALAGAAGVLIGMVVPFNPFSEARWTLYAFVVVVVGGFGKPLGALLGGLILGLVWSSTISLLGSTYVELVMFSILLLMLLIRPQGILGGWGE